jgi:hypothetical protein
MKHSKFLFFLALSTLFLSTTLFAQTEQKERFRFLDIKLHSGSHFYSGQNLNELLQNGYGAMEVRYGWQTKSTEEWAKGYNFPSYGIGWYSGYIGDVEVFGNPNAMYLFMDFPITHHRKHTFIIGPALGLTYNLKPYNPLNNPINDAIGSRATVYFNLNFGGNWAVTREVDFTYGIDFTHFSNGRTFVPNYGLNMLGINLGMRYNFNRNQKLVDNQLIPTTVLNARPTYSDYRAPRKLKASYIRINQSIGTVQRESEKGTDLRYFTNSTMLEFQRQLSELHGVSIGADLFYDGSLPDAIDTKTTGAVHAGYHLMWWDFEIGVQFGTYLSQTMLDRKGLFFMRPSLMYKFNKHWYTQVGLKTLDGGAADWVEYGIGYRITL